MKVLGICGAQGALLFPFRDHLVGNVEPRAIFHTPKEEQWKLNFGEIPFVRDPEPFFEEDIDIVLGSPSCGHSSVFSYSRKKTLGKPREDPTLNLYLASLKRILPKVFILENLPKLLEFIPKGEFEHNLPQYEIITHCHSVMEFGNSQKSRKRLIMVGVRRDCEYHISQFERLFRVNVPMTVRDIEKKVRKELNYREESSKKLAMYHYKDPLKRTLTVKEVKSLWRGEFKNEFKWPMKTHKMKTLPGVYRNRLDAYPLTIRPSNRQFNPHGRVMGLEEFRIIMGFPPEFKIYFDPNNRTYWLNKARNTITKGSVYEVGIWTKICLEKNKNKALKS